MSYQHSRRLHLANRRLAATPALLSGRPGIGGHMPAYSLAGSFFLQKPGLEQAALDKLPGCLLAWRKSPLEAASQAGLAPREHLLPTVVWI